MKKLIATLAAMMLLATAGASLAENTASMANPWRDVNFTEMESSLVPPDGADTTSLSFRTMNDGEMEEIDFSLNGSSFTARACMTDGLEDISGVYGEAQNEESVTVNGCEGRYYTVTDDQGTTQICQWYDAEEGTTYCLTAKNAGLDKDGLLAIAEGCVAVAEADSWSLLTEDQATDYSDIIEGYVNAYQDMNSDTLTDEEKQELHEEYKMALDARSFGYTLKDVDGDGTPELLLATDDTENDYFRYLVTAMYRVNEEGSVEKVFESTERDRWYYAGDNLFANVGSSSADDSFDKLYAFQDGQLMDMGFSIEPSSYQQLAVTYLF